MAARRSSTPTPRLLNDAGQRLLEDAYARKLRDKCSFVDFANGYLERMKDDGSLTRYLLPGVDPFSELAAFRGK